MLTESEIFDCLGENLLRAADRALMISKQPRTGLLFIQLRSSLKLAEGACRQAAHYRGDVRWAKVAVFLAQAHQMARGWLHYRSVAGQRCFLKLAEALLHMAKDLDRLELMATGRSGLILTVDEVQNPLTRIAHMAATRGRSAMPEGLLSKGRAA